MSHGLLDIVKDDPAFLNTGHNGYAKLSSTSTISADSCATLEPFTPMANISLLQGRGIIDTVSGDSNNKTHSLTTDNNFQFESRRCPGEDNTRFGLLVRQFADA